LNKMNLVKKIAEETGKKQTEVHLILTSFLKTVKETVAKGDPIQLIPFGTFKRVERKARKCRNPKTGAIVDVPAKKVPRFVPGREFRDIVAS